MHEIKRSPVTLVLIRFVDVELEQINIGRSMKKITSKMLVIKNYYYLIVVVLSIISYFTHGWNGQTTVFPIVNVSNINLATKTTIFYVWHILTAENLIFGVSFLVMAFHKDLSKVNR